MKNPIQIQLTVRGMSRADFLSAMDNALRVSAPGAHAALSVGAENKTKKPEAEKPTEETGE